MPELSVIVPVYKVEEYLPWCLDSLVAQTAEDLEFVCVNDGSPDSSVAILERYAAEDSRFFIISKENGGLSSARNAGIKVATAPYVCFVDSDDRMMPDAAKTIIQTFAATNADVITYGATCYPEGAGNDWLVEHLSPRDVTYEGFAPDLLFKEMSRPFVWRTACKREFLLDKKLLFDETVKFGEDQVFHFSVYPRASKTVLMSNKLYEYRVAREGSLMERVEQDQTLKMREHLNIISHIFADLEAGGFLRKYPAELAAWTVEFALYGISKLPAEQRGSLLALLVALWSEYFSSRELQALALPRATRKMMDAALLCPESFAGGSGKRLRYAYYAQEYGIRTALKRAIKR